MKKYTVIPRGGAPVIVEAERVSIKGGELTLLVGDQLKAFFPHVESVVVDLAAKPRTHSPVEASTTGVSELRAFEFPAPVSIGSICITVAPGADVKALMDGLLASGLNHSRGDT